MLIMKKHNQHTDVSAPQSVTEFIKLQTGGQAIQIGIQIGFTDQKVSPQLPPLLHSYGFRLPPPWTSTTWPFCSLKSKGRAPPRPSGTR